MPTSPNLYRASLPARGLPKSRVALSCFRLSLRDVALILATRGIIVSNESIREWGLRFGLVSTPSNIAQLAMPPFARGAVSPKSRLPRKIQHHRFAHHAPATGNLTMPLDMLVWRRRDKCVALKIMCKLLRKQGFAPRLVTTDKCGPTAPPSKTSV